jgi:hypothetical protein
VCSDGQMEGGRSLAGRTRQGLEIDSTEGKAIV